MMQMHTRFLIGATAVLLAAAPAFADLKIAVVRSPYLLENAPQAKASEQKLHSVFDKRSADFETAAKQFNDDKQKFQLDADTLSATQKAAKQKDLESRASVLSDAQQKMQEDYQTLSRELQQSTSLAIRDAIEQVAKEKGYDLVVSDPVYAKPAFDITDDVLHRLTAQESAPPAAPAAK
jgi:outer membrane protein